MGRALLDDAFTAVLGVQRPGTRSERGDNHLEGPALFSANTSALICALTHCSLSHLRHLDLRLRTRAVASAEDAGRVARVSFLLGLQPVARVFATHYLGAPLFAVANFCFPPPQTFFFSDYEDRDIQEKTSENTRLSLHLKF